MMPSLVSRMHGFGTTIFAEMSALAAATGSINLGQGFPDSDGPASLLQDARAAIAAGANQYPPGRGILALRGAIADHQRRHYSLELDPDSQVLVTTGATEAIAAALLALLEPGDEVVMFEPYYDSYAAGVALASGVRRTCVLRFPDFAVDPQELRACFSERTKIVLLNTPHNPTGKVFSTEELALIAELAIEFDALVLTDEVYEHLVYDDHRHLPIATLPGMADRTLTISSAGKTFAVTGWKIGWISGPAELVTAVATVKQFLTFVSGSPFQPALAQALTEDQWVQDQARSLQQRRDLLSAGLRDAGLKVTQPAGSYFVIADAAPLGAVDGLAFCRELPTLVGVVGVPVSVFHDDPRAAATLVRFAFCKQESVLTEAVTRLRRLAS